MSRHGGTETDPPTGYTGSRISRQPAWRRNRSSGSWRSSGRNPTEQRVTFCTLIES